MTMRIILAALPIFLLGTHPADAAQRPAAATLRIVVHDPSGAVVPGALARIRGTSEATSHVILSDLPSDGQGVVLAKELVPGPYVVEVSFPGFETCVLPDVRVRAGDNKRDVTLA